MKCVLISFFNSHNIGDCLIADILYKKLSSRYITEKLSYSGNPNIITNINDLKKTNSPLKNDGISSLIHRFVKKYPFSGILSLYRKFKQKYVILKSLEKKIWKSDVLVIGGGNMIFDTSKNSNSAFRFSEYTSIAKKHGKKVFVISIGIGPFVTIEQEKNAIQALEKCDYITFRDKRSLGIYTQHSNKTNNVFLSVDPVFSLPYSLKKDKLERIVIGLNVFDSRQIGDDLSKYKRIIDGYARLANLLSAGLSAKIVLFSTDMTDYDAVCDVYKSLQKESNVEIAEINGLEELLKLYDKLSILIGTRMHSMIIALSQIIPVVGLSWQPKVDALFEIFDLKDRVFKYDKLNDFANVIVSKCSKILEDLELEQDQIYERLELINKIGEIDMRILEKIEKEI